MNNLLKRIAYTYFLRNFSAASLELFFSIPLVLFGIIYGFVHLVDGHGRGYSTAPGIVMAAALPLIIGTQLFLSWLNYDVYSQPSQPIHTFLDTEIQSHDSTK